MLIIKLIVVQSNQKISGQNDRRRKMGTFVKEIEEELTQKLIPFWENLRDEEYGGFYGYMGYDLKVQKDYEKGCI